MMRYLNSRVLTSMKYLLTESAISSKFAVTKNLIPLCLMMGREEAIDLMLPMIGSQIRDDSYYNGMEIRSVIFERLDELFECIDVEIGIGGFGGFNFCFFLFPRR